MIKVCIICKEHGEFWQRPNDHLKGNGCLECHKKKYTIKIFIQKAILIHGNKYDYSKVEYKHSKHKICIICPIHGEFLQSQSSHLQGCGCPKCRNEYNKKIHTSHYFGHRITTEEFIEKARLIHGDKYDYSKIEYINSSTKVCIICPIHGEFWQTPNNHLSGKGCQKCNMSHLELNIKKILINGDILFEQQKTFEWLKYKSNLYLDFYLPEYNIAIECQGRQHFEAIEYFGGNNGYKKIIQRDEVKKTLCKKHGIILIYIK